MNAFLKPFPNLFPFSPFRSMILFIINHYNDDSSRSELVEITDKKYFDSRKIKNKKGEITSPNKLDREIYCFFSVLDASAFFLSFAIEIRPHPVLGQKGDSCILGIYLTVGLNIHWIGKSFIIILLTKLVVETKSYSNGTLRKSCIDVHLDVVIAMNASIPCHKHDSDRTTCRRI